LPGFPSRVFSQLKNFKIAIDSAVSMIQWLWGNSVHFLRAAGRLLLFFFSGDFLVAFAKSREIIGLRNVAFVNPLF
jgi:hypothetical protein